MERRKLGKTDLELPVISYGASSLGQEFRRVTIEEALQSCRVALDLGMNFIDTSPFYGRGMSEVLLGQVLRDLPREDLFWVPSWADTIWTILISPPNAWPKAST